jgi:galactokinase
MVHELNGLEQVLKQLYGGIESVIHYQSERYHGVLRNFQNYFSSGNHRFFSTPGRTEIGGNHTDHNHGRVLAASVNLDSIAAAAPNNSNLVKVFSEGYSEPFLVDLSQTGMVTRERGTTSALIRGIANRLNELGFRIDGFNAFITSDVLPGSGLSSSASIEVLIGTIFNYLFNDGKVSPEQIASIGQFSENYYFGKPCGLMDQMTCAVGGIVSIDFKDPQKPLVKKVNFDFSRQNYGLLVVDTGGNHADLTDDYAAVPLEMKSVAKELHKEVCRELEPEQLIKNIPQLRKKVGDRAVLRALHFLADNERVLSQVAALESGDFYKFLQLVNQSGNSSFKWLQNIYTTKNVKEQGVSLALALTENYLSEIGEGACRVHGGGFAGTIQVFMPSKSVQNYAELMETVFGKKSVLKLNIRPKGTFCL